MTPNAYLAPFLSDGIDQQSSVIGWGFSDVASIGEAVVLPRQMRGPNGRDFTVVRSLGLCEPYIEGYELEANGIAYMGFIAERDLVGSTRALLLTVSPYREKTIHLMRSFAVARHSLGTPLCATDAVLAFEESAVGETVVYVPGL